MIDDIGDVEEESDEVNGAWNQCRPAELHDVCVVGVIHLDRYSGCIKRTAEVVPEDDDPELGHCVKCKMMQCVDAATQELSVQLMVKGGVQGSHTLRAFGKIVQDIAQKPASEVTMSMLLKSKPFTLTHRDGIMHSITRKA